MAEYTELKDLIAKMDERLQNYQDSNLRATARAVRAVEATAKESIMKGGSGRVYKKYNPERIHRASAPNKPPASDTGFLVQSISHDFAVKGKNVAGYVIAAAPYAKHLEFGTKSMLAAGGPRPFLQPALDKNKAKILKIFKEELRGAQ